MMTPLFGAAAGVAVLAAAALFADAESASQATGPVGMVLGGAALFLVVADKVADVRTKWRKGDAEVATLADAADGQRSEQWRALYAEVKEELAEGRDRNRECEERSRQQQTEIDQLREIVHRVGGEARQAVGVAKKIDRVTQVVVAHHPEDARALTGSDTHRTLPPGVVERRNPDPGGSS